MKTYYRIVQNWLTQREYEYTAIYNTIEEAQGVIAEYEKEDRELLASGDSVEYHDYTILDETGEDAITKREKMVKALVNHMAMSAMRDIGLTEDEAEMQLEDIGYL